MIKKLTPSGIARFVEPARGNLALRAFRALTPWLRTVEEHPLDEDTLNQLRQHFEVTVTYHALLRPFLPMLFLNHRKVTEIAKRLDAVLLRSEFWRRQAWLMQIELKKLN